MCRGAHQEAVSERKRRGLTGTRAAQPAPLSTSCGRRPGDGVGVGTGFCRRGVGASEEKRECKKRVGQEGDVRVKRLRACRICLPWAAEPFASLTRVFLRVPRRKCPTFACNVQQRRGPAFVRPACSRIGTRRTPEGVERETQKGTAEGHKQLQVTYEHNPKGEIEHRECAASQPAARERSRRKSRDTHTLKRNAFANLTL